jgi:hypothetical protein
MSWELRDEPLNWELREQMVEINKSLDEETWHWAKQPSGAISLPDFIQLRAKGEAKMANGHVYLKKPGADPELVNLFKQRIADAEKLMDEEITKKLYAGTFGFSKAVQR